MKRDPPPPFLLGLDAVPDRIPPIASFPFSLPFLAGMSLRFRRPVSFFVGENGTGKSTLLEAIAALCGLPVSGGSWAERDTSHGPELDSHLSFALRPSFRKRPKDGFFLRAEFQPFFASLLDERGKDPDFQGNPYARYGGRSLHQLSHGEAFLAILQNRIGHGLWLLDEPESALSPQRQLALLSMMHGLVEQGAAQFIIATHSPILLTYPGSEIVSFDEPSLPFIQLEQTSHFQITQGILRNPEQYWRHLAGGEDSEIGR
jgi:predicted ATPase